MASALVRTRAIETEDLVEDTVGIVKNCVMGDSGFLLPGGLDLGVDEVETWLQMAHLEEE